MNGRMEVDTTVLQACGGELSQLAPEMRSALLVLPEVAAGGAASEHRYLANGAEDFAQSWGQVLAELGAATEGLGLTVSSSACCYDVVETENASAMEAGD